MKKLVTLFVFLLLLSPVLQAQPEVSTRLQNVMRNSSPNDYLRILVYMNDQVDIESLDARLYRENATLKRRAYEVITALQNKANATQPDMIAYFENNLESREVFKYESYWVANMFMVECNSSIVKNLMTRTDVGLMDLDALLDYDRPVEVKASESILGSEAGLKIINAHKLWALGITGQGQIVMDIDTGVDPTHPALNYKYRGNHVPAAQAWFDPSGSTTPSDCDGHGTHTLGTMTGRTPAGDTVGVAPDAEWIAAKTICTSPHTSNSVAAFQWSISPDGDPNTISDMPASISNSWYDPDVTNECSSIYKTTLDAVEAAGIGVVFSAGNSGPGSTTITKPKNINTDEVNIWATGAIDGVSYLGGSTNPIASFSSRGPSTCGGSGSLLIKPEGSAPGVNVRSSYPGGGYTTMSGTSMASPHVAGAIALLKSFAPNLTGKQIKMALYNTAKDLGTPGEDNVYGMGLIDVYAAFVSLGTPDVTPPNPITDLQITDITSNSLSLVWTVPFDSSMGGVTGFDIRISNAPITDTAAFYAATEVPFNALPDTAGALESITVDGLNFSTTYHFAIRARDVWSNWSDISNPVSGTTYGAPQVSVTPNAINRVLVNNQTYVDTIHIANVTGYNSTLDYTVAMENSTFPTDKININIVPNMVVKPDASFGIKDRVAEIGGLSIEGAGGPDLFGYSWIDSDDPNGPAYDWNDISTTGTLATTWTATGTFDPKDEGYCGPFTLGFDFKFYGATHNQVYVNSNGPLLFSAPTANMFSNVQIPNAAAPNGFIAAFWDDLDGRTQGTVHYKQEGNKFIVQFTGWQKYSATGSLTWQYVLYNSGKVMIYYNNMNATLTSATVGVENQSGTDGLQIAYNAAYVKNNLAVKISADPDWLAANSTGGTLTNGTSANLLLTFNTEDFPLGNYGMDVVIASNDPANATVTVPVSMTIGAIPVELTSFTASTDQNNVVLNWSTATETNNRGFSIERKSTKDAWNEVEFVNGAGTSTNPAQYSYIDKDMNVGKYTYRLKQVDMDGTYEYTNFVEIEVSSPTVFSLAQNYPNPFNPTTVIEYSVPEKAEVTLTIYSSIGELVKTLVSGTVEPGYQKISFNASELTSGTYIYQIRAKGSSGNYVESKKMMFIK
ncbi:MAG: S8 family serine peptidase [Ignavibacteriaceae bacterium]|nr:S8 family serine peptidase [Ignavibacteriaceae bacterium]